MKLSKAQQEVVNELKKSPFSWISSLGLDWRLRVVCPASGGLRGNKTFRQSTIDSLVKIGVLKEVEINGRREKEYVTRHEKAKIKYFMPKNGYVLAEEPSNAR